MYQHVCVDISVYMCKCVYVCISVYMYAYIYVDVYVYMCLIFKVDFYIYFSFSFYFLSFFQNTACILLIMYKGKSSISDSLPFPPFSYQVLK